MSNSLTRLTILLLLLQVACQLFSQFSCFTMKISLIVLTSYILLKLICLYLTYKGLVNSVLTIASKGIKQDISDS